jgi:glutathione peroxidase
MARDTGNLHEREHPMTTAFDFDTTAIDGKPFSLAALRGRVLLVVNTASACGFTPQLKGLQALWEKYEDQGLVVLGFPCNQFGGQDPKPEAEIAQFCEVNYGVGFPMMAKVDVNGTQAPDLFKWMKAEAPGVLGTEAIKWNFTKFLIGRDGQVLRRYAPQDRPESIARDIEKALAQEE